MAISNGVDYKSVGAWIVVSRQPESGLVVIECGKTRDEAISNAVDYVNGLRGSRRGANWSSLVKDGYVCVHVGTRSFWLRKHR